MLKEFEIVNKQTSANFADYNEGRYFVVTNHDGWYCSGFTENQAQAVMDKFNELVAKANSASLALARLGGGNEE